MNVDNYLGFFISSSSELEAGSDWNDICYHGEGETQRLTMRVTVKGGANVTHTFDRNNRVVT